MYFCSASSLSCVSKDRDVVSFFLNFLSESFVGIVAEGRCCSDLLFIVEPPRAVYLFTSLTDIGCHDLHLHVISYHVILDRIHFFMTLCS